MQEPKIKVDRVICGKSEEKLKEFPDNFFSGIVTDPPYELNFMNQAWDSSGIAYSVELWKEVLRVSKPGSYLFCFGGTRTHHRVACAIEDAGWLIRDEMDWIYGVGFPKSSNISKQIDRQKGAVREVIGTQKGSRGAEGTGYENSVPHAAGIPKVVIDIPITAPSTELAKQWDGYGTTLKPAREPIIVAMKPLEKGLTFAANAEKWGTAGFNIDGGRISSDENKGRWPANILLSHSPDCVCVENSEVWACTPNCPLRMMDAQSFVHATARVPKVTMQKGCFNSSNDELRPGFDYGGAGGASRFFYCAKPSRKEKDAGLLGFVACEICGSMSSKTHMTMDNGIKMRGNCIRNNHLTVKPVDLMRYCLKLIQMPNDDQVILDPFCGSGTTLVACQQLGLSYIGIDMDLENVLIANARYVELEEHDESLETSDIANLDTELSSEDFADLIA